MIEYYSLNRRTKTIEPSDMKTWAYQFQRQNRRVAYNNFYGKRISTVFLGMDHSFGLGRLAIFETMVFGSQANYSRWRDEYLDRYATWAEAVNGHKRALHIVCRGRKPKVWRRKMQNRSRG